MDRFDFVTLPFNELTSIQPHTKFKTAAQLQRGKWYGNDDDDTPTFEELVRAHDESKRDESLDSYASKPRTRWTVVSEDTIRRERYDGEKLTTLEIPTDHITPWGQKFSVETTGEHATIRVRFGRDDQHGVVYKSPVTFHHDVIHDSRTSGKVTHVDADYSAGNREHARDLNGKIVTVDRIARHTLKTQGNSEPLNAPTEPVKNTLWTKEWVTITLIDDKPMISKLKMRVRSSMFNDVIDCGEFQPPAGQKVSMVNDSGSECPHGIGASEAIKVGDAIYDAEIGKPVFFWFYQERHRTNIDGISVPRKQPLQQQTRRKAKVVKLAGKGDKQWVRLNIAGFDERYTIAGTAPPPGIIVSSRQAENYRNLGIVRPSTVHESIREINGVPVFEQLTESYDFADEQEESRYQRMLDKHDDDMDTNVADLHVYDEIAQEDFVSTLDNAHEIQQFASDDFEIGSNGTVFEKHENMSVRNDPEDAEMMNLSYLARALEVSEERAAEIQAQLDTLTLGDNQEKQRWIERLRGQSTDMTSDEAYKWLAECSSALDELEADTEEITVASTSDFSQADITITVGTSDDTRIDPAEEKELAVNEIHEMFDDGSGNPALAPKHMESYSDLLGELHNLTSAYQRRTTHDPLTLNSDNVPQFEFLKTALYVGNGEFTSPRFDALRREIHRQFQPRKQTQQLIDRINAKGRLWVWERAHENQIERAAVLNTVPGVISAIKVVNAMMKYGLADNMIDANERLRKVVDDHPVVGYHTLKFANQFYGSTAPPAPARQDRLWTPPAEEIHAQERELLVEDTIANQNLNPNTIVYQHCWNPENAHQAFESAKRRFDNQQILPKQVLNINPITTPKVVTVVKPVCRWYSAVEGRSLEPSERIPVDEQHPWKISVNPYAVCGIKAGRVWIWRRVLKHEKVREHEYNKVVLQHSHVKQVNDVYPESKIESVRPFLDVTGTPSYGYHKIESNNVPDSVYTQVVELQRKLWDFDNLTRNGKPNPLWLYRIYPRLQAGDGEMLKTRRQATESSIAFFHKDAPPPMPKLGVHNGGEEYLNGSQKTFIYKAAEWMI